MPSVKFDVEINVNGKNVIASVSADAKKLASNLDAVSEERNGLRDMLLKFNQLGQSFQNLTTGLQQLTGVMQTYTTAYNTQVEAETRLMTVMRQRMGASEDDIRAIMDLTSAQQQLGVVGDEVQLMGAQQIATFATQRQTLEALIPAMNNLLVQQKGLKATGQDAVSVANMIGKALQGQDTALSKVGISMSDAEKHVIKYGTETERAAAIAQIITNNVGEMNAEMAKTDAGKAQQLANTIGDLKEQVGALFSRFEPVIIAVGELGEALNALATSGTAIAAIIRWIHGLHVPTKVATALQKAYNWEVKEFRAIAVASAMGASKLQLALYGLRAAAGPIMLAVTAATALYAIIRKLSSSSEEAAAKTRGLANATETLKSAEEAGVQAAARARTEIDSEIKKLNELIKGKKDASGTVQELNNKYGEWFGQCKTAQQWYDTLISKSDEYCRQLAYEAQMRIYAQKEAELMIQQEINLRKQDELRAKGGDKTKVTYSAGNPYGGFYQEEGYVVSKEMQELRDNAVTAQTELKEIRKAKEAARALMGKTGPTSTIPTGGNGGKTGKRGKTGKGGKGGSTKETYLKDELGWYDQEIERLNKKKLKLTDSEEIAKVEQEIKVLKARRRELEWLSSDESKVKVWDSTAVSQVSPGSAIMKTDPSIIGMRSIDMTGDDWIKRVAGDWEDNKKAMEDYFKAFQSDFPFRIYDAAKKKAAEHNKNLSEMGQLAQQAGQAFAGMGKAFESPVLQAAGIIAQAIATMLLSYAQATAESAKLGPLGWAGMALGGLATVTAVIEQMKNIGQYAKGGIAYGPTLGLFGEYTGARANPEVVAPLDRLRSLMGDTGGPVDVRVRIKERDLVGFGRKSNRYRGRM